MTKAVESWNRFWFTPEAPHTLAAIRVLTGGLLLYSHAVWGLDLAGFFGPQGRIPLDFIDLFHADPAAWSMLRGWESVGAIWTFHLIGFVLFGSLFVGCFTRIAAVLSFLWEVSYVHRGAAALFGFDQILVMLTMYLMVGDSGGAYSVDAWRRRPERFPRPERSTSTNLAIRLIQVHMCIVYFFAATGKLRGDSWWEGTAVWLSLANYEYQSVDVTFLGNWPLIINAMTHVTLFWELAYGALIWPRWSRPWMLALAIPVHGGIAVCLGMITFGTVMLVGNLAFVPAATMCRWVAAIWPGKVLNRGDGSGD